MNVFDFAMKMEEDGKAYYEKLASQTSLPGLKTIFTRLAEDEQKHYELFQELKTSGSVPTMQDTTIIAEAKNIFEELPKEEETLKGLKGDLAAYQHAMEIESESFRFYENAAKEEKNPATKKLLTRIASEEHKHFNVLENIFHFVNAPNQSLAWGEFSNLNEFGQFGRDVDS
ncbi:MAG: ferritin family protein [Proteobacteria bacterium]|nr:ferritin family protein [Pseudomonadota bacterium]